LSGFIDIHLFEAPLDWDGHPLNGGKGLSFAKSDGTLINSDGPN